MAVKKSVVITGLGVVAANGVGLDAFWRANLQGRSGVASFSLDKTQIAAEVKDFIPEHYMSDKVSKRVDRFVHLGLASAGMALKNSRLALDREDKTRIGVIIGSGLGGQIFHEQQIEYWLTNGRRRVSPLGVPAVAPNSVSGHIAIQYGLQGPNGVISTACASGTQAIGEALRKIQYDEADLILTGGAEAPVCAFNFCGYGSLRVLSKKTEFPAKACRPFDRRRDGFVLGEGAAMLLLEEKDHALKRNAHIYAELAGYGLTCGAHSMVIPKPDGSDAARAMELALTEAMLAPNEIDYINAHGTGTRANDLAETTAIKRVFGDAAFSVPVSSTKSMIGHTIGASGAIEAVICCKVLQHQIVPPTINHQDPDPDCDLDYVPNVARKTACAAVMSNSFGFGGVNASIIFKKTGLTQQTITERQ